MTTKQLEELIVYVLKEIHKRNKQIGKEYPNSDSEDRLENFKIRAEKLNITPFQACHTFLAQHLKYIELFCKSNKPLVDSFVDEHITEAISYLILLKELKEDITFSISTCSPTLSNSLKKL